MTISRALRSTPLAVAALLAACGSAALKPTPPTVVIPGNLRAPANESLVRTLWADGVQIYECRKAADASFPEWVFVAPEAKLADANGTPMGKHYAGPTWEASDGSKIMGEVVAKHDAPDATSIPWLLLRAKSTSGSGIFSAIASVQRLKTSGGSPPATGCDSSQSGKESRVPYSAEYRFYKAP